MFKTTDLTRTTASAGVGQQRNTFLQALRLTVAAILFVLGTFLSFGASVSVANAKTAAKKTIAVKTTKAKAKATIKAKAKPSKLEATKATAKAKAKTKALAMKANKAKTSKSKQFTDKAKRGATKAKALVSTTAKKAAQKFTGNFALLNRYKQDLAVYGAQKLESWSTKMTGEASWYGTFFHGRLTASGRRFNKFADIAAHRSLPFGTILKVTNKDNGKTAMVEVLDRGPYVGDRLIDLSHGTAQRLGYLGTGTANVETEILKLGTLKYEIEAPLTAAELRGEVIKHRIDLNGIDLTKSQNTYANSAFIGSASFGGLLPELKPDMDAFAQASIVDSPQLYAILNYQTSIRRA